MKHDEFIQKVRGIVVGQFERMPRPHVAEITVLIDKLLAVKLVYGAGSGTYRGICFYNAWQNGHEESSAFCEIAASGEENPVQLAGTTIHELGHTIAVGDGHGRAWREACKLLGLRGAKIGQRYQMGHFSPAIRSQIAQLLKLTDGNPLFAVRGGNPFAGLPLTVALKPCPMGHGARGGKSRGTGSGSRLRLYTLEHECLNAQGEPQPKKLRIGADDAEIECSVCHKAYTQEIAGEESAAA
jgi:hypothetical protein